MRFGAAPAAAGPRTAGGSGTTTAARAFPPVSGASASVADLLLEGYSARFTLGYQASVEPFRAAVTALLADGAPRG
jgi:hypothetical protein